MKIKNSLWALGLTGILLLTPNLTFAQTASPKADNQASRLATLHTACDDAVSIRLTSLQSDLNRINSLIKLSADDKTKYIAEINTNISGMNAQETKCDGDTDLATLKTDYQNVFLNFRVFAVFLPQINLLTASDTMGVTSDNELTLYNKLQTRVAAAGNPPNLVNLLSDMHTKIVGAQSQYSNVESLVTPLTPQSYNSNSAGTKTILTNARADIKTGADDLKAAFQDALQIRTGLKGLKTPAPSV